MWSMAGICEYLCVGYYILIFLVKGPGIFVVKGALLDTSRQTRGVVTVVVQGHCLTSRPPAHQVRSKFG